MRRYHRSPGLALEQCRLLVEFGKHQGLSAESCLEHTDIHPDTFNDLSYEPSATQELQIIQNICSSLPTKPERLGYEAGRLSKLHNYGLIGQAMLTSNNLLHALNIALRYCKEVFHFTQCSSTQLGDTLTVEWRPYRSDIPDIEHFLVARDLGTCLSTIDHVLGKTRKGIISASAFFTEPELMQELAEQLGCPIQRSKHGASMIISVNSLLKPMPQCNPQTSLMLEQFCYDQLRLPERLEPGETFTEHVAHQLRTHKFNLSREEAAKELNISSRTLSRYLLNEKTTWRELVAAIRIESAKQLLTSKEIPIELVAEHVGFGSSSAFSLAFRRATGTTPREFRKQFASAAKSAGTQVSIAN